MCHMKKQQQQQQQKIAMGSECKQCQAPTSKHENLGILASKTIAASALVYLLYIAVTCPCKPALYSCHLSSVYMALAVVVAVIIYYNGLRFKTWNGLYAKK